MNLFLPKDLCSDEGLSISQRTSVWILNTPSYAWDTLLSICAGVTPVGLWFVILLEPDKIGYFFSPAISTHKGFTSDTFKLIRHGLVPECECISFHECYLCDSEKKIATGVDDSRCWQDFLHMLLQRWQTMINKQTFTQCDVSCLLTLAPDSSRVSKF